VVGLPACAIRVPDDVARFARIGATANQPPWPSHQPEIYRTRVLATFVRSERVWAQQA
jgi:hypothetical protein